MDMNLSFPWRNLATHKRKENRNFLILILNKSKSHIKNVLLKLRVFLQTRANRNVNYSNMLFRTSIDLHVLIQASNP